MYMLLISMTDRIRVLAKRSGNIGEKAKVGLTSFIYDSHTAVAAKKCGFFSFNWLDATGCYCIFLLRLFLA